MTRLWFEIRWCIAAILLSWVLDLIEREADAQAFEGIEMLALALARPTSEAAALRARGE